MATRISNERFFLSRSQRKKLEALENIVNFEKVQTGALSDTNRMRLYLFFYNYMAKRHDWNNTKSNHDIYETFRALLNGNSHAIIGTDKHTRKLAVIAFMSHDPKTKSIHGNTIIYDTSPEMMKMSPGTSTILYIAHKFKQEQPSGYFYLGSWSPGSPKLGYKNTFHGVQYYYAEQWNDTPKSPVPNYHQAVAEQRLRQPS